MISMLCPKYIAQPYVPYHFIIPAPKRPQFTQKSPNRPREAAPMSSEKVRTDQLLSKLAWLQGRSQPDFKGHVPAAEPRLTANMVRERREAEAKKRCSAEDFLPFQKSSNKYVNMRFDATKPSVRIASKDPIPESTSRLPASHPHNNIYRQELDPSTGRPAMNTVLSYNEDTFIPQPRPTGRRTFRDRGEGSDIFLRASSSGAKVHRRPDYNDIHEVGVGERLNVLRADLMRHPMFTAESKIAHSTTHWDPMTQLLHHQFMESPPRKERPTLQQKKNPVRMVEVMRRSKSARPWH